ncbi:type I-F CRISPR-associated endoribonuclease Cas6/Csy4 [Brachymonas sp. M4Q-1]|uniref:type I-F CRISPR-associated endoribonuclease Cas6/Csy4 n=1 Tax=Brachymonas sp. M4Q-1 TaxID=3416906 RepID=UPI003CEF2C4D
MTTHYLDFTLQPDPEFPQPQLMSALMAKLHRALVQRGSGDIGISFPHYVQTCKPTLGATLRLHGTDAALRELMAQDWLRGMRELVEPAQNGAPLPVPPGARALCVQRRQFDTSIDRLRRRRMLRKGETPEQAEAALPQPPAPRPTLPHVHLRSTSTGQSYCLHIDQTPVPVACDSGQFNTYGLSHGRTVPYV